MFRFIATFFSVFVLLFSLSGTAQAAAKIGDKIPHDLSLRTADGKETNFDKLKGEKGLVLFFVRSADWCPFCKRQMVDFGQNYKKFMEKGYAIASVSYDDEATLNRFKQQKKLRYSLISDPRSESIKAFGLLHKKYKPGSRFYGIPHPAIYVINADGVITHLFAESGYQSRPPIGGILRAIE